MKYVVVDTEFDRVLVYDTLAQALKVFNALINQFYDRYYPFVRVKVLSTEEFKELQQRYNIRGKPISGFRLVRYSGGVYPTTEKIIALFEVY